MKYVPHWTTELEIDWFSASKDLEDFCKKKHWRIFIPNKQDMVFNGLVLFAQFLVLVFVAVVGVWTKKNFDKQMS